jgi:hypothetical protein
MNLMAVAGGWYAVLSLIIFVGGYQSKSIQQPLRCPAGV